MVQWQQQSQPPATGALPTQKRVPSSLRLRLPEEVPRHRRTIVVKGGVGGWLPDYVRTHLYGGVRRRVATLLLRPFKGAQQ